MYQLENGKCYDSQYWTDWVSNTHIKSSKTVKEIKEKFENAGVLLIKAQKDHNKKDKKLGNHEWARLCLAYCFAKTDKIQDWIKPEDTDGLEIDSFNTMFNFAGKTGEEKFWLTYISYRLFSDYPDKQFNRSLFLKYIQYAWHTGAILLWNRYEKALNAFDGSVSEAQKILFAELAELASNHQRSAVANVSGNLKSENNISVIPLENAPIECKEIGQKIVEALQSMGKGVKKMGFLGKGVRYDFYRVQFAEFTDWDKIHERLCSELSLDENDLQAERDTECGLSHAFRLKMKRDEATWQNLDKNTFQAALKKYSGKMLLPLCIGADEMGNPVFADLHEARHVLVGGTPGSGKSVMVRTMLASLFELLPENMAQIAILDATGDYSVFQSQPNLWSGEIKGNRNEVRQYLEQFVDEMKSRLTLLQQHGADHISKLPENVRPHYFIVMLEELAALLDSDKNAETPLVELLQEGRKAGILLIMATQELDSATFSKRLRANIPSRIAMRVSKSQSSVMILGETGAENLAGSGDHLVKWNGGIPYFLHGFDI